MKKPKIICITGADGTGKSTLVNELQLLYPDSVQSNIWDLMYSSNKGLPFKSKTEIDNFLCGLTPDSRLLFLSHALKYSIDIALEKTSSVILANGYFYKYFASELALGASPELVEGLEKSFPKPDIVIQLELDINMAVKRKINLSRYECGLSEKRSKSTFIDFQRKALKAWERYDKTRWHSVKTDGSEEIKLRETRLILGL